jgi:hypothetical protein
MEHRGPAAGRPVVGGGDKLAKMKAGQTVLITGKHR